MIVWTGIIVIFTAVSLIPINISAAAAQTSNNNNNNSVNYANECIRLGISLDKCTELVVLYHRGSHPVGATLNEDNSATIMNWELTLGIIGAILGVGVSIFFIRSSLKKRSTVEHR